MLGAFCAQDLALFVLFFDLMLVPFYFLVGQWGGPDRVAATYKLIIYTLVGSLLMLAGAVATACCRPHGGRHHLRRSRTCAAPRLERRRSAGSSPRFALAFLIKMPLFPFHGWMPDAYRTMPLPALAIFSGVLSKVAAYGFLRIVLPLFPAAAKDFQSLILILALLSILYGSAHGVHADERAPGARLLVGRAARLHRARASSRSTPRGGARRARCCRWSTTGSWSRRCSSSSCCWPSARAPRTSREMGGLAFRAPVLATLFLIVALATLAMPGSANFVGEFLILLGVFQTKLAISLIAFTGVAMASVYMLRMYIRDDAQPAGRRRRVA